MLNLGKIFRTFTAFCKIEFHFLSIQEIHHDVYYPKKGEFHERAIIIYQQS